MGRVASVRIADLPRGRAGGASPRDDGEGPPARRLAVSLLAASPRVMVAGPGLCRVDARGWERRGGEVAFARALHAASRGERVRVGVGIADGTVASDAAATLAAEGAPSAWAAVPSATGTAAVGSGSEPPRTRIVAPGGCRAFLSDLPLSLLGLPEEMTETLRVLGFRKAGELAARNRAELEARFGPAGVLAHRRASGEGDEPFRPLAAEDLPGASVELEAGVREVEPLLFVLGPLLDSLCEEVGRTGWSIRRLLLRLEVEGGGHGEVSVRPARPTLRRDLLHELCRAGLERAAAARDGGEGRLPAPVVGLSVLAVVRSAPAVRQEELFRARSRDPVPATAALSRIRARLGEDAVVAPLPRPHHRPERRNGWRPVSPPGEEPSSGGTVEDGRAGPGRPEAASSPGESSVAGVLRLLPEPRPVDVRWEGGRPVAAWDGEGRHEIVTAEGPERLSGEWWEDPYRREYYRACTADGELLWLFREYRSDGAWHWWLHGWWD